MLAVLRGQPVDRIPWVPRMDLWYPHPMTRLTLAETRRALEGRITIMGGFPSVAPVKEAMTDRQFDEYLDDFFRQIGRGDRLILGISDTTPPGAEFDRLLKIRDRIEAFGPVLLPPHESTSGFPA